MNSTSPAYGVSTALSGNGVDFTLEMNPSSGSVVAGNTQAPKSTVTPLAGFNATITLSCTTTTPASTCVLASASFVPATAVTGAVTITTTAKYPVIGYGGLGGGGWLSLFAVGSGWLLWRRRRGMGAFMRRGLIVLLLGAASLMATGCSGKLPTANAVYTTAGGYTYTLTATDGKISHSATYSLQVTAQ